MNGTQTNNDSADRTQWARDVGHPKQIRRTLRTTFPNPKILALILCLLLGVEAAEALIALPPSSGTNVTEIDRLNIINASHQRDFYFCHARIDRLQVQVNQLETGFLIVAVLLGSTLGAVVVLMIRDRIRKRAATTSTITK